MRTLFTLLGRPALLAGTLLCHVGAQAQVLDPTFQPVQTMESFVIGPPSQGNINVVLRQPDGKYLIGGRFTDIGGVLARNVARLLPNGSVDPSFAPAGADGEVSALALQPDGKIVVGGYFGRLAGGARYCLGRLLPDGTLDAAFNPPMSGVYDVQGIGNSWVRKLIVQPDGQILVGGLFNLLGYGANSQRIMRVSGSTGQPEPGFQPFRSSYLTMQLQPDGKILVGGTLSAYQPAPLLHRLNADGTSDGSFPALNNAFTSYVWALTPDGNGNTYAGGLFNGAPNGGPNGASLRRIRPDGSNDPAFWHRGTMPDIRLVAVQPDGRVLTANTSIERLNADGTLDGSFVPANAPYGMFPGYIQQLLTQPDGAIVVAGRFNQPGLTGLWNLVRLSGPALPVRPASEAQVAVWPVPAREVLHLRLSMADRPQHIQLLDALGRVARQYQPAAELSLPVADLPAGSYQLRVGFADGSQATRRVLLR